MEVIWRKLFITSYARMLWRRKKVSATKLSLPGMCTAHKLKLNKVAHHNISLTNFIATADLAVPLLTADCSDIVHVDNEIYYGQTYSDPKLITFGNIHWMHLHLSPCEEGGLWNRSCACVHLSGYVMWFLRNGFQELLHLYQVCWNFITVCSNRQRHFNTFRFPYPLTWPSWQWQAF